MEAGRRAGFEVLALSHETLRVTNPSRRFREVLSRRADTRLRAASSLRLIPPRLRQAIRDCYRIVEICQPGISMAWAHRDVRADLYHAHDLDGLICGSFLAWKHGARLVYDSHEYPRDEVARHTWVFRSGIALLENSLLPRADAVIAVSPYLARRIAKDCRIPQPEIIRNIPPAPAHYGEPRSSGLWYYGFFQTGRSLDLLFEAIARTPKSHLLMQGMGILEPPLRKRAEENDLRERVTFLPPAPPHQAMASPPADIGIYPLAPDCECNRGSLANKLFVYLHAGLLVLGPDIPAVREEVGDWPGVFLCHFSDSAEIGRAIDKVLSIPPARRRELGQDNRERARRSLSWEAEREKLADLYRRLLS
jgi:glycosyltransferase involved in cell wall biosynthesis